MGGVGQAVPGGLGDLGGVEEGAAGGGGGGARGPPGRRGALLPGRVGQGLDRPSV